MRFFTTVLLCVSWVSLVLGQPAADSSVPEQKTLQPAPDTSGIDHKPIKMSSGLDEGQLVEGQSSPYVNQQYNVRQWISRLNVFLNGEAVVANRLTLKLGVGAFVWYAFPELPTDVYLVPKFSPAVSEASGTYKIGKDLANPLFEFQFGYFPFKYNPDAYDMGEYLLKSGAYPGYLVNGRWNIIGDNLYRALGIRFSNYLLNGAIEQHFLATMELNYPPMYDVSPSYIIKGNIAKMLSLGAGVSWAHAISMNESKTTPKDFYNRYLGDSALNSTEGLNGNTDTLKGVQYYTFRGIKLMGMASFDIKPVIPTTVFGKEDLKIFAEAAVLGVQNYPFYYDDITKRIPVMFGFNFPTFKLLDVLSFEWEYYGSQFDNNMMASQNNQDPIWYIPGGSYNPRDYDDTAVFTQASGFDKEGAKTWRQYFDKDNWKWAIYIKKSLGKAISLHLQFANDHMHMMTYQVLPDYIDATHGVDSPLKMFQKQWYFDFKVQIGI
ncbi:MAG TPA: hypothetical protein VLX68_16480 [Chitinivibrionales bacterium]|nr:hypothetical protein [Chitinivibrionales bacterium]